jgi:phospholipid/cholesterol/gamma-HCH transport system permease protein
MPTDSLSFTEDLGKKAISSIRACGGVGLLFGQVLSQVVRKPFYSNLLVDQIYQIGLKSSDLVFITAIATGMVMSLQFGLGLEKFGGKLYIPKIVSLSIIKELGPVFCSLMLAARVGAGIASEIGSMTVTQQIDAIRALGTSPIKKIVIPRMLACLISFPILITLGNILGVGGALIVGKFELGLDPGFFVEKVFATVKAVDYLSGILKTVFFALWIGLIACYFGLKVKDGTRGVGIATTQSVVASSVMILISDFFLTKLFHYLFYR